MAALVFSSCTNPELTGDYNPTSEGTLVATTRTSAGGGAGQAVELAGDREGVLRRGGKLFYVKDRGLTEVVGAQRLTPGLLVERNGDVMLNDGRRFPVREGTMVTVSGEVIETPPYLR